MLYGVISAYIMFHGEISAFMLHSCITELALGPFGPQSSLSSPFCSQKALGSIWKALGILWRALGGVWRFLGAILNPLGTLLEPSWSRPEASWRLLEAPWSTLEPS